MKHCTMCHQPDGSGVSGMYPPLKQTDWVSGDPDKLVGLILKGQQGNIEVNGKSYKGVMPAQNLSDEEIARVLTYIRSSFGNHLPAVAPDQVAKARKLLH